MSKTHGYRYGGLDVKVSNNGPLWNFTISDNWGHSYTGLIKPNIYKPGLVAREAVLAMDYFLDIALSGHPIEAGEKASELMPGVTLKEVTDGALQFEGDLQEAAAEIRELFEGREEGGHSMGAYRTRVECRYKCPGDTIPTEFAVWPRKGETSHDACRRYLKENYAVDDLQFSLCEKIQIRYID
jgi:hypothetical protein